MEKNMEHEMVTGPIYIHMCVYIYIHTYVYIYIYGFKRFWSLGVLWV